MVASCAYEGCKRVFLCLFVRACVYGTNCFGVFRCERITLESESNLLKKLTARSTTLTPAIQAQLVDRPGRQHETGHTMKKVDSSVAPPRRTPHTRWHEKCTHTYAHKDIHCDETGLTGSFKNTRGYSHMQRTRPTATL